LLFAVSISFAQYSLEEKLQQLKRRTDIKVTEVEKDILKLEYPGGKVLYKNIGEYQYPVSSIPHSGRQLPDYSPTFDSTIIDLTTIDTLPYYRKYSFWQEVLIANYGFDGLVVGDINNNGMAEIYGFVKDYTSDYSDVVVKELNENGTFDSLQIYDDTNLAVGIYDVNKDGNLELELNRVFYDSTVGTWPISTHLFFEKETDTSLATDLSFIFQITRQDVAIYRPRVVDLDGDEYSDYVFTNHSQGDLQVYEYNPATNNFDSVYYYNLQAIALYFLGFAIGDYDLDSKPEFFIGSSSGKVVGFESTGNNTYQVTWISEIATNNLYLFAETNDIDGNGKKEFWIGGDSFYNGVPITRLTCFESIGNNSYEAVARIDIIGFFSFFAFNMLAMDVTKDGVDELILCLGQTVIILKFTGSPGNHSYEVYYIKQNERVLIGENSVYYNAAMYDINSDGKEEILITADHVIQNTGIRFFTQILKPDKPDNVDDEEINISTYELFQNYPNPFNSSTQIRFRLQTGSNTS
ncbi:MAG TPA: hemagglutinin, partial [Ignavibacteriaceae bacterium]